MFNIVSFYIAGRSDCLALRRLLPTPYSIRTATPSPPVPVLYTFEKTNRRRFQISPPHHLTTTPLQLLNTYLYIYFFLFIFKEKKKNMSMIYC